MTRDWAMLGNMEESLPEWLDGWNVDVVREKVAHPDLFLFVYILNRCQMSSCQNNLSVASFGQLTRILSFALNLNAKWINGGDAGKSRVVISFAELV